MDGPEVEKWILPEVEDFEEVDVSNEAESSSALRRIQVIPVSETSPAVRAITRLTVGLGEFDDVQDGCGLEVGDVHHRAERTVSSYKT